MRFPGLRIQVVLGILALFVGSLAVWLLLPREGSPPEHGYSSVVLISIDTCRADHLSCYGFSRETSPQIDAVARDGARFTRVHSTNPITLPAHASMLTGTTPVFHGVRNNHNYRLADDSLTLAELLLQEGYRTAAFVSAIVLEERFGLAQGFQTYDDATSGPRAGMSQRSAGDTTQRVLRWLRAFGDQPFFLFVHYFDPHMPYAPPEPFASRFSDDAYAGEIAYVDNGIGQIVTQLKSLGLYENSLIAITADHGESLGEHAEISHSYFIYESTIRVPLILKPPASQGARVIDEPASLVDLAPTVLGLLDLARPPQMQGEDLSPWIRGRGQAQNRSLYCESLVPMEYGCSPLFGLIQGDFKYIWSSGPELFDLERDPAELENLTETHGHVAEEMQAILREMLEVTADVEPQAEAQAPDPQTLERLRSLGYAGGTTSPPARMVEPQGEDPKDFVQALNRLVRATQLRGMGRLEEARRECLAIIEERPGNLRALQMLGDLSLVMGRYESAVDYYSQFLVSATEAEVASRNGIELNMSADLAEVHFNLGNTLHRTQQLERAEHHYQEAIRLQWDNAHAHNGLGALLAQLGRTREAVECFKRALSIDPQLQSARANLEMASARLRGDR